MEASGTNEDRQDEPRVLQGGKDDEAGSERIMVDKLFHKVVRTSGGLVTDPKKTTRGFIVQATEKMRRATAIVEEAHKVERKLERVRSIQEVLRDSSLTSVVLSCAGLSAKAQSHLSDRQLKDIARAALEDIAAAGGELGRQVLFRYLLTVGDSLGGTMRNWTGSSAQGQVTKLVQDRLTKAGVSHTVAASNVGKTQSIQWEKRLLAFDKTPRFIGKNVDVILLVNQTSNAPVKELVHTTINFIAVGELKGGIDPAGADEH